MYKRLYIFLFFFPSLFSSKAQILYSLDKSEIGRLTINTNNTCDIEPFWVQSSVWGVPDIALHPNGKLYAIRGRSSLVEVDIKHQSLIFVDSISGLEKGLTSLECDKDGRIYYAAKWSVGYYDLEKGQSFTLRNNDVKAAGDIAFIDNKLLIAQRDKSIITLDKTTLSTLGNPVYFPNLEYRFGGLVFVNNTLYGSSVDFGNSRIYKIDLLQETATLVCEIILSDRTGSSTLWGLTSEESFRTNFEMYLDLDADNSAGRFINHFQLDTFCTRIVPIADSDVRISANFPIDSITIQVETGNLAAAEKFIIPSLPNSVRVIQQTATQLTLLPQSNATFQDFESVIQQMQYEVSGEEAVKLQREVAFIMYGNEQVSDIARAFLQIDLNRVPYAGMDFDTLICPNRGFPTLPLLGENADQNGIWQPPFSGPYPNTYLALTNPSGKYQYIAKTGDCPADTAQMTVRFHTVDSLGWTIENILIFLCNEDDTVWIDNSISDGVIYIWNSIEGPPVHPITADIEFYDFQIIDKNGCVQAGAYYVVLRDEFVETQTEEKLQFCPNESYEKDGIVYRQDTMLCETFTRPLSDCDSTHCLQLSFDKSSITIIDTIICDGEVFDFFGTKIDRSGVFNGITERLGQCDSLVDLFLTVLPPKKTIIDTLIKSGESLQIGGFTLKESRTYFIHFEGANGCDSLVQVTLDFITATSSITVPTFSAILFPNPSISEKVQLRVHSSQSDELMISLYDSMGRLITQELEQISAGNNQLILNQFIPVGIYWVRISNRKGQARYLKGIKGG